MKHSIFSIIFAFITTLVQAAPIEFITQLGNAKNLDEIRNVIDSASVTIPIVLKRELVENYHQNLYYLDSNDSAYFLSPLIINLISKESQIIYGELLEPNWKEKIKERYIFQEQKDKLNAFISKYNKVHQSNFSSKKFMAIFGDIIEYSFGCGYSIKPHKEAQKITKWIAQSRKDKIMEWLKKPNPEYQAYAAFGLSKLKKKGVELTVKEQSLLDYIIQKNHIIYHCSGCLAGLQTPLKRLIN